MADQGKRGEFHLTQEEVDEEERFEASITPPGRRSGLVQHGARFWCGVLLLVVGLIVRYPRKTPCRGQLIYLPSLGSRATIQRCAPPGQRGGVFYGMPHTQAPSP